MSEPVQAVTLLCMSPARAMVPSSGTTAMAPWVGGAQWQLGAEWPPGCRAGAMHSYRQHAAARGQPSAQAHMGVLQSGVLHMSLLLSLSYSFLFSFFLCVSFHFHFFFLFFIFFLFFSFLLVLILSQLSCYPAVLSLQLIPTGHLV